uniref:Putative histone H1-like n=1 Tax=Davidia involucrata TaxID=16924 RepID=A0A5B7C2R7_DAVIN
MASVTAKKPSGPKKPRAHPPYVEMIKEAIVALKERTGSSKYAISKFIEEKQKGLPPNFQKLLLVQLKKLVASGKLTKVKNSFKLSAAAKPVTAAPKKAPKAAESKAPAKKKVAVKPKSGVSVKPKKATPVKAKKVAAKPKAVVKPKKAAKTATLTSPGKKKAATPAVVKAKKVLVKAVKKPKSIKSPAKKAPAKKGKK